MEKCIVTAALSGAGTLKWHNENLPITPEEFAEETHRCRESGAAIVHIHARDPDSGLPSPDLVITKKIIDAIRERVPDIILNMSTAISTGLEPSERIAPVKENLPELASFNTSSMNFALVNRKDYSILGETIFDNTFETMAFFKEHFLEHGIKPEFELYDFGGFYNLKLLERQDGFFQSPHHYQLVFDVAGGVPFTPMNFAHFLSLFPDGSTWSVCGVGRDQLRAGLCAAASGGHIRVGLEDHVRNEKGELARGSYEQVEWAVRVAQSAGRNAASPDEARKILGLKQ